MATPSILRQKLAQVERGSLNVRARALAEGYASGTHRADRKGSGVEFAGHRTYSPGDDLRHLDRHAFLRHKQLLVREFLTDTERNVHIVVDVTASMRYRGTTVVESKSSRALLLGAAIAHVARRSADPVGLTWISESEENTLFPRAGTEAFERCLHRLETLYATSEDALAASDPSRAPQADDPSAHFHRVFSQLGSRLARGTVIFVLSDFLDAPNVMAPALSALCTQRRSVRALQILTEDEVSFPFDGALRLQDPETGYVVQTDAANVRAQYQTALSEVTSTLVSHLERHGGKLFRHITSDPPEGALLSLLKNVEGARP